MFVANYISGDLSTKDHFTDELLFLEEDKIKELTKDQFAEFYYEDVIKDYFTNQNKIMPLDFIIEMRSFDDKVIQDWMAKGTIRE